MSHTFELTKPLGISNEGNFDFAIVRITDSTNKLAIGNYTIRGMPLKPGYYHTFYPSALEAELVSKLYREQIDNTIFYVNFAYENNPVMSAIKAKRGS